MDDSLSPSLGFNHEPDNSPTLGGRHSILADWEAEKAERHAGFQKKIDKARKKSAHNEFIRSLQIFLDMHGYLTDKQVKALSNVKLSRSRRWYR